jgi:hypothetical protein
MVIKCPGDEWVLKMGVFAQNREKYGRASKAFDKRNSGFI